MRFGLLFFLGIKFFLSQSSFAEVDARSLRNLNIAKGAFYSAKELTKLNVLEYFSKVLSSDAEISKGVAILNEMNSWDLRKLKGFKATLRLLSVQYTGNPLGNTARALRTQITLREQFEKEQTKLPPKPDYKKLQSIFEKASEQASSCPDRLELSRWNERLTKRHQEAYKQVKALEKQGQRIQKSIRFMEANQRIGENFLESIELEIDKIVTRYVRNGEPERKLRKVFKFRNTSFKAIIRGDNTFYTGNEKTIQSPIRYPNGKTNNPFQVFMENMAQAILDGTQYTRSIQKTALDSPFDFVKQQALAPIRTPTPDREFFKLKPVEAKKASRGPHTHNLSKLNWATKLFIPSNEIDSFAQTFRGNYINEAGFDDVGSVATANFAYLIDLENALRNRFGGKPEEYQQTKKALEKNKKNLSAAKKAVEPYQQAQFVVNSVNTALGMLRECQLDMAAGSEKAKHLVPHQTSENAAKELNAHFGNARDNADKIRRYLGELE